MADGPVTRDELAAIARHAEADYPQQCCGLILERGGERLFLACRNAQNELRARDPVAFPRSARHDFAIDPADLLLAAELTRQGWRVTTIYHSRTEERAEVDALAADLAGAPSPYRGIPYVVVAVPAGRPDRWFMHVRGPAHLTVVEIPAGSRDVQRAAMRPLRAVALG